MHFLCNNGKVNYRKEFLAFIIKSFTYVGDIILNCVPRKNGAKCCD